MAEIKVESAVLGEIIKLLITEGVPAGIKLLGRLNEKDITAEKVRALRIGLRPPVKYGEGA